MAIQSMTLQIPDEVHPNCPKCGSECRLSGGNSINDCIYECGNCGLQFEATIALSWDSKHYDRKVSN